MKAIVIGLIVVLAMVGVVIAANNNYQNQQIPVQYKQKVYCTGAHHVGNVVFEEKTLTKTVARKDRGTVHDLEDRGLCPVCQAREERELKIAGMVGTWIFQTGIGSATIRLQRDGTGYLGDEKFKWELEGSNRFSGIVNHYSGFGNRYNLRRIFGHVTPSGDLFTNYEPMFGGFGSQEQTIFKRVE